MTHQLVGRDAVLAEIEDLLAREHHVLLYGVPWVGKSALIAAVAPTLAARVAVLDPFVHVTPRVAAAIRRAMDIRGQQYLAATRSLDRRDLGAVRRIAWRFTTVRVPPLTHRETQRVIERALARHARLELPDVPAGKAWVRAAAGLAEGRPGVAVAMVEGAVGVLDAKGRWPSPPAAFIAARVYLASIGDAADRSAATAPGP